MSKLRTISIKTQVRRLKYFSILVDFVPKDGIQKQLLETKVIDWSKRNHQSFLSYNLQSGEILKPKISLKSQSFNNYFDAANQLGLLIERNNYVILTRIGETLKVLKEILKLENQAQSQNAYKLNKLEKVFLIYVILKKDADILFTILQMLSCKGGEIQDFYIKSFQVYYKNRLNDKFSNIFPADRIKLNEAYHRVKNWKNPKRYCEDIVPSRLNWLLDLSVLDRDYYKNEKKNRFSKIGNKFYNKIPIHNINDNPSLKEIDDNWLSCNFIDSIVKLYFQDDCLLWEDLSEKEKESIMNESFFLSINNFASLGIPRLSIEQTLLFITIYNLFKRKIIINLNQISDWIGFEKTICKKKIGLRDAERPGESYIIISNVK